MAPLSAQRGGHCLPHEPVVPTQNSPALDQLPSISQVPSLLGWARVAYPLDPDHPSHWEVKTLFFSFSHAALPVNSFFFLLMPVLARRSRPKPTHLASYFIYLFIYSLITTRHLNRNKFWFYLQLIYFGTKTQFDMFSPSRGSFQSGSYFIWSFSSFSKASRPICWIKAFLFFTKKSYRTSHRRSSILKTN